MSFVYKILTRAEWERAVTRGAFEGSALDLKDGFIHLSDEAQAAETLKLHFAGRTGLLKVGFEADALGPALRWEPSRGGALFPHLYAPLPAALAVSVEEVFWPAADEGQP